MVISEQEIELIISSILNEQQLAVLSTQRDGQPYSSLMAFAFTDDLTNILLATSKATRKHQNIIKESRVSLLVDNRANRSEDFHEATALTIIGKAEEISKEESSDYVSLYLLRHPYLDKFLSAPTTSLLKISVTHYLIVSQFQNVMEYNIGGQDAIFS